jgi:hypothetical protein
MLNECEDTFRSDRRSGKKNEQSYHIHLDIFAQMSTAHYMLMTAVSSPFMQLRVSIYFPIDIVPSSTALILHALSQYCPANRLVNHVYSYEQRFVIIFPSRHYS